MFGAVLGADIGLSLTGVAGPAEQDGQPAGTLFVGLVGPGLRRGAARCACPVTRDQMRQFAVITSLGYLREHLLEPMNESSRRGITIGASIAAVVVLLAGMGVFLASRGGDDGVRRTSDLDQFDDLHEFDDQHHRPPSRDTTTTTPLTAVANAGVGPRRRRRGDRSTSRRIDLTAGHARRVCGLDADVGPRRDRRDGHARRADPDVRRARRGEHASRCSSPSPAANGVVTDDLIVRVFEDAEQMVFVDGELGNDEGDGTMAVAVPDAAPRCRRGERP